MDDIRASVKSNKSVEPSEIFETSYSEEEEEQQQLDDLGGIAQTFVRFTEPTVVQKAIGNEAVQTCHSGTLEVAGSLIDKRRSLEDVLNLIEPVRCWEKNGEIWRHTVSNKPASRQEAIDLEKKLDDCLYNQQARNDGFCPIRRRLYTECFNELIRQCAVDDLGQGLLLLRIRDEAAMSMQAYKALYSNSADFGMQKAIQAQKLTDEVQEMVDEELEFEAKTNGELKEEQKKLDKERLQLKQRIDGQRRLFAAKFEFLQKIKDRMKATVDGLEAKQGKKLM